MEVKNPEGKSLCSCRDANEERGREGELKPETGLRHVRACVASRKKRFICEKNSVRQVNDWQEEAAK
jgi:hypothetical protein